MSGRCTGWVLRHGPRNRAMRAILIPIADAANQDGEHAHPGIAAIVEGSLYSRPQVMKTLAALLADGWIEIEEEGRGRGHSTVYRLVMDRSEEKVSLRDPSEPLNGLVGDEKRSRFEGEKVSFRDSSPLSPTDNNGKTQRADADDFDLFWREYPERNGKRLNKSLARSLWSRLSEAERQDAMRGAAFYGDACDRQLTIAKDPDRWLKHRCWVDWQEPATRSVEHRSRRSAADARKVAAQQTLHDRYEREEQGQ